MRAQNQRLERECQLKKKETELQECSIKAVEKKQTLYMLVTFGVLALMVYTAYLK